MISLLLITHIILMTLSVFGTSALLLARFLNVSVYGNLAAANLLITTAGLVSGVVLLLSSPIDMRCILLTAYVVVFSFAHSYIRDIPSSRQILDK